LAVSSSIESDTFRDEVEDLSESVARGPRSEAALTVLRGENVGALYPINADEMVIGRSTEVGITLPDDSLSRQHARIFRDGTKYMVEDLGSTNGTFVDGDRLGGPRALEDGCRIHLGSRTVLHFRLHDAVELEAARQTYALAVRDPLTGVFNRRHMQERLWSEAAFARRHHTALSLILLDIDHFKRINDEHGHAIGDAALVQLAGSLTTLTRQEDVLARYGGEEFALIARGIDRKNTVALAERMRSTIEAQRLAINGGEITLTVSIGIAHCEPGSDMEPQQLFEAADRALYEAKDGGRNQVSIAPVA
jgi:diguanylate cyclase (GGDEF)-like protein